MNTLFSVEPPLVAFIYCCSAMLHYIDDMLAREVLAVLLMESKRIPTRKWMTFVVPLRSPCATPEGGKSTDILTVFTFRTGCSSDAVLH